MSSARPAPSAAAQTGFARGRRHGDADGHHAAQRERRDQLPAHLPFLPRSGLSRLRLEVDRVERQGEPDEHTDRRVQSGNWSMTQSTAGTHAAARDHASRGSGRPRTPRTETAADPRPPRCPVDVASHYNRRVEARQRARGENPRAPVRQNAHDPPCARRQRTRSEASGEAGPRPDRYRLRSRAMYAVATAAAAPEHDRRPGRVLLHGDGEAVEQDAPRVEQEDALALREAVHEDEVVVHVVGPGGVERHPAPPPPPHDQEEVDERHARGPAGAAAGRRRRCPSSRSAR